jgi:NTP pyrophosphatase (non-canonical NTP hydrolase)
MNDLKIDPTSSLAELQGKMSSICKYFQWDAINNEKTFLLFIEEVGELARAIRYVEKIFQQTDKASLDDTQRKAALESEFADVLSYLFDLASRYQVDLGRAFAIKMEQNLKRSWKN